MCRVSEKNLDTSFFNKYTKKEEKTSWHKVKLYMIIFFPSCKDFIFIG